MKLLRNGQILLTLFLFLITGVMTYFVIRNIYFDSSFYAFLDETSPSILASQAIAKKFGDANTLMILLSFDPDRESEILKDIEKIAEAVRKLPFVQSVDSIFQAQKAESVTVVPPFVHLKPYVQVKPAVLGQGGETVYTLDKSILQDGAYTGIMISEDGKSIALTVRKTSEGKFESFEIVSQLKEAIQSVTKIPFHLVGEDLVDYELFASIQTLTFVYPPLILVTVLFIFLLKFRSFYLSFLTLIPPVISSIWMYFLMLLFQKNINSLTVMLPSFIIIIGSAYGMHYLSRFLELRSLKPEDQLSETLQATTREERTPIYFSALTTVAGFSSYIFLKMEAFRDMGLFTSIGIFLCSVFTLLMLPVLLKFYKKVPKSRTLNRQRSLPKWVKIAFTVATFVGIVASPFLIANIPQELDSYGYFKGDSEIIQSANLLKTDFGWVSNFYLVFETKDGKPLQILNEEALRLQETLTKIEQIPHVVKSLSIFTLSTSLKVSMPLFMNMVKFNPQGREMTRPFLTEDSFRVMVMVDSNDTITAKEVKGKIEEILAADGIDNLYKSQFAGTALVWSELSASVVNNQVQSIFLAFVMIFLLLVIIFRKIGTVLFSVIPIGITVLFNFVFMSLFRIPFDIPTALISGMLMGLVIDYAIHYMYWYKKFGSVEDAYKMTASPILFNGLSLMGCFGVLLTAPLSLYINLAILMILGIGMGVLSTLIFLPTILSFDFSKIFHKTEQRRKDAKSQPVKQRSAD